jgi:hypothetical protein
LVNIFKSFFDYSLGDLNKMGAMGAMGAKNI